MRVEPENRLVADSLEADWNEKLRALTESQEYYEQQRAAERLLVDEDQRAQIMALANDFPHYGVTPPRRIGTKVYAAIADRRCHTAQG